MWSGVTRPPLSVGGDSNESTHGKPWHSGIADVSLRDNAADSS